MIVKIDNCRHRQWMLGELHGTAIMAKCSECGAVAEFHEYPDSYRYSVVASLGHDRVPFGQYDAHKHWYAESDHVAEHTN